jgi:hypothetical protein
MSKRKPSKRPSRTPWFILGAICAVGFITAVTGSKWGVNHRAPEVNGIVTLGDPFPNKIILNGNLNNIPGLSAATNSHSITGLGTGITTINTPEPASPPPPKQVHHAISHRAPSIVRSPVWYLHNPQVWE